MNFNDFFKHFFGFDKRDKRTTPPGTLYVNRNINILSYIV